MLPRSAGGNGGATARAFRNAAELALRDFPERRHPDRRLRHERHAGRRRRRRSARALQEGAEIILGPVFSSEVVGGRADRRGQAGVPVVAFSSDAGVAGPGVYLLSFLPSDDVEPHRLLFGEPGPQILRRAAAGERLWRGGRRRRSAAPSRQAGGRIVAIQTYQRATPTRAPRRRAIAAIAPQIDALLIPDAGDVVPAHRRRARRERRHARQGAACSAPASGTIARILNNPALVGSWFPAPVEQGFESFSRKYQAAYGAAPPRNATLAYDATVLAAGLVRQFGAHRFEASVLTSPNGFAGIDGIFRFLPSGLTERRLAVYEVTGSGARIVDPAGAAVSRPAALERYALQRRPRTESSRGRRGSFGERWRASG